MTSAKFKFLCALSLTPIAFGSVNAQSNAIPSVAPEVIQRPTESPAYLNNLYSNQWVHLDKDGSLTGSVVSLLGRDTVSLSKVKVSLVQSGAVVAEDDTDVEGEFLFEGLQPGLYTLQAETVSSMALFSLAVLDSAAGKHLPSSVEIRMTPVSSRVMEILRGQSIPKAVSVATVGQDPISGTRKSIDTHEVALGANGTLKGRLGKANAIVDMSSMTVFVMKDGEEVKRATASTDGSFSVTGLAPGCYGLVAAGEQGAAVTAFCAVSKEVATLESRRERFVAAVMTTSSLNVEVGDPVLLVSTQVEPQTIVEEVVSTPLPMGMGPGMGGFAGGGSMGSGGGGGAGVGRLGRIAGFAGLGLGIGALIASDNNNDAPVSPVSQ